MRYFRNAAEIILLSIIGLLACLFCAYAWPEATYGMAAWVQAIGSIAAIVGAVAVADLQSTREKKIQIEAEYRACKKSVRLLQYFAGASASALIDIKFYSDGDNFSQFNGKLSEIQGYRQLIEGLLDRLPYDFLELATCVHVEINAAEKAAYALMSTVNRLNRLTSVATADSAIKHLERLSKEIDLLAAREFGIDA